MISDPSKIQIAILRGGPSPEYEVSLQSGQSVLDNLPREIYEPIDVLISKDGLWHENGFEKTAGKILEKSDVVFNCLHGAYGEDGGVQSLLDKFNIPYTGSDAMASALGMNKIRSRAAYSQAGLKIPFGLYIKEDELNREKIKEIYNNVPMPFVVKPSSAGSSIGVNIAYSLPELEEAVVAAFEYSPSVLIEEFISGKEGTCGVVDEWRDKDIYALLPIEIKHKENFFDYNSKYSGEAEETCPGLFTDLEKRQLEEMAVAAHRALGLRHYSRSDFRIHPKRGIFILETNTLPGLTKNSLLPKSLTALGTKLPDFLHHIISLALKRK